MAMISLIAVHMCDGCKRYSTLSNDEEFRRFGETWFSGISKDYCPECRDRHEHQPEIITEERRLDTFEYSIREAVFRINEARHVDQ